jgi:hypothetical protein
MLNWLHVAMSKPGLTVRFLGIRVLDYRSPQVFFFLPESLESLLTADYWWCIVLDGYNECNGWVPFSRSWWQMHAPCVPMIMDSQLIVGKAVNIQWYKSIQLLAKLLHPSKYLIDKKDHVHIGEDPTSAYQLSPSLCLQVIIIRINMAWSQIVGSSKTSRWLGRSN